MTDETKPPAVSPRIVENSAGQPCYIVEYDEDQWLRYDKDGQDFCFDQWTRKAKPLGAMFVVLRLVPDALFPSGDKTVPYVARSVPVDQDTFNPVTVSVRITGMIHANTYINASEGERMQLKTRARQDLAMHALAAPGCSYEICTRGVNAELIVIERGRL